METPSARPFLELSLNPYSVATEYGSWLWKEIEVALDHQTPEAVPILVRLLDVMLAKHIVEVANERSCAELRELLHVARKLAEWFYRRADALHRERREYSTCEKPANDAR